MVVDHVALGEVEECIMLQQSVLEVIALHRRNVHVRSNATAAIHGTSAISEFYFAIGGIGALSRVAIVVVVVERNVAVIALDQASAWGVVMCGGQCQAGI